MRNAGFSPTVSTRALISRAAPLASLDQEGTRPQRTSASSRLRSPSRSRSKTAGIGSVGATFHAGAGNGPATSSISKTSVSSAASAEEA